MSGKRFDASLKDMIEQDAPSWARRFSKQIVQHAALVDADVSTVTAAADKVLRVEGDRGTSLLNIEPESRHAGNAPDRLHLYSTILRHRHQLPVRSVLLLLRRESNATNLTGILEIEDPEEEVPYLIFRYQVVRVWQEPLAPLLSGGLGPLPLAVLTDEAAVDLPGVLRSIDERLRKEAPAEIADRMWTATFVLMGLRYEAALTERLFLEITTMEESSTYQALMSRGEERGKIVEARRMLLRQGRSKFGEPDTETLAALDRIANTDRLEDLGERLLHVASWQDLLING